MGPRAEPIHRQLMSSSDSSVKIIIFREEDWIAELVFACCQARGLVCRFAGASITDWHAVEAELRFEAPSHVFLPAMLNVAGTDKVARRELQRTNLVGVLAVADICRYILRVFLCLLGRRPILPAC